MLNILSTIENEEIDILYQKYLEHPDVLDDNWRLFFEGYEFARLNRVDGSASLFDSSTRKKQSEFKVINLINEYRTRGHLFTKTNPVRERRKYTPTLEIGNFGLSSDDLESEFEAGSIIGIGKKPLKDIISFLELTYCSSIGVEYRYIRNPEIIDWLEKKMESVRNRKVFSFEEKIHLLTKIDKAVAFESFLHKKFVGQKSFSLEGCEALIPALDYLVEYGAELGIEEFVLGMAHRGRLNVMANLMGKSFGDIFSEFEGLEYEDVDFGGDVKYHLGYSADLITSKQRKVHLSLAPNPSHLEAVGPVVQGIVRARIDQLSDNHKFRIIPVLIHGDAAIAGQGVVYEVIQMSQLRGFRTGGIIHFVINNQIGFTTSFTEARSSTYCTDIAKVTLSPVFHVNADDVEAVIFTVQLAIEFRQKFHGDVFVDLLGYRKYGHNESDEPRFTQPLLYKAISTHLDLRAIYTQQLIRQYQMEAGIAYDIEFEFKTLLQNQFEYAKQLTAIPPIRPPVFWKGAWDGLRASEKGDFEEACQTAVDRSTLLQIGDVLTDLPPGKIFFDKTVKLFSDRKAMIHDGDRINWAMAEALAFGSLLWEGFHVWFSGQDVERGTFSHRHAVIQVEGSEERYVPLNSIRDGQAKFIVHNSLLSEYAVLGFEYGYSICSPNTLVVWEAQFGDFVNGAQIVIDQYLSSASDKWNQMSGLVLLLPHGFEGQGAEHSSARLERFLQLCAEDNLQIVNCSSPSNYFHVLRRQLKRDFRKPLVIFTPKSLLRHPGCISSFDDFSMGGFKEIIDDADADPQRIKRLVFCSGKLYFDLSAKKHQMQFHDTALVRIEQLYPFPRKQFQAIVDKYGQVEEYVWAQEEPENMGAWGFMLPKAENFAWKLVARAESASVATGSYHAHDREQQQLIDKVFTS